MASSNFREIWIFWSFYVIWHLKIFFVTEFFIRLALCISKEYLCEKNSGLNSIFTKCHAFYDCKNIKKLESEIWPLSEFFHNFVEFFFLFHLSYNSWTYENKLFFKLRFTIFTYFVNLKKFSKKKYFFWNLATFL